MDRYLIRPLWASAGLFRSLFQIGDHDWRWVKKEWPKRGLTIRRRGSRILYSVLDGERIMRQDESGHLRSRSKGVAHGAAG